MARADPAQLTIRSGFARARAPELTGMTTTQVIEEALRGYVPVGTAAAAGRQVRRGPILVLRTGGETISQAEADAALDVVRGADQVSSLELKVPNAATRAAMAESNAIMAQRWARARGTPEA